MLSKYLWFALLTVLWGARKTKIISWSFIHVLLNLFFLTEILIFFTYKWSSRYFHSYFSFAFIFMPCIYLSMFLYFFSGGWSIKHLTFSHHPKASVAKYIRHHLSNQHIVFPALMCIHVVYDTLVNSKPINYVIINHIQMIYCVDYCLIKLKTMRCLSAKEHTQWERWIISQPTSQLNSTRLLSFKFPFRKLPTILMSCLCIWFLS